MRPRLTARVEHTQPIPVLLWQFGEPRLCISSGPLGGGVRATGTASDDLRRRLLLAIT